MRIREEPVSRGDGISHAHLLGAQATWATQGDGARTERPVDGRIGGAEDGKHGSADGGRQVHGPAVVAGEEGAARAESAERAEAGQAGQVYRRCAHETMHRGRDWPVIL